MIKGIGTDIIEIARVEKLIQKYKTHFLYRTFTPEEIKYCKKKANMESFAVRIAAKEALFKATGIGWRDGFTWKDFEILNDDLGKPIVHLHGKAKEFFQDSEIHISLSHDKTHAIAFVIVEKKGRREE